MPPQERAEVASVADAMEMPSRTGPSVRAKPSLRDYPSSDGEPMAETPRHWRATVDAADSLRAFFAHRPDVYVGSDMMMYYIEDNTRVSVSPDVFVTFGVDKLPERRVWRTWKERGRFADFVLEITSESSQDRDEGSKKELYERLGVREYWQLDPDGDYLDPVLKGRALDSMGRYQPLALEERDGGLCHGSLLGVELRLEEDRLRLFDPGRGAYLLTGPEKDEALREKDGALRAAEAEIAMLRRRLRASPR